MNNIILVGFMAVGKSTVGKSLKQILHFNLWDIDRVVEEEERMTVADLFALKGEDYFREREKEIALRVLARNNNIISFGGGLFLNPEIREIALSNNFVVFLDLNLREVFHRIKRNDKRPLAKNLNFKELRELYEKRLPVYKKASFHIKANKKKSSDVAGEIATAYYRWLNKE